MKIKPQHQHADETALIAAHESALIRYLRYLGANADTSLELAQECLMLGIRHQRKQQEEPSRSWLRGVARNQFFKSHERDRFRKYHRSIDEAELVWSQFESQSDGEDYVAALGECLATLTPRSQRALELQYQEQRSMKEIARELAMKLEGVRTLLQRSRKMLKACIEKRIET